MTAQHIAVVVSATSIACAICFLCGWLAGSASEIRRSLAARMED